MNTTNHSRRSVLTAKAHEILAELSEISGEESAEDGVTRLSEDESLSFQSVSGDAVQSVIQQQLELMKQQLELLKSGSKTLDSGVSRVSHAVPSMLAGNSQVDRQNGLSFSTDTIYPLTEPVTEIWLASQASAQSALCFNEAIQLNFSGPLDPNAMHGALDDVMDRHEGLRATFLEDGEGFQIQPNLKVAMSVTDLSDLDSDERDERVEALLNWERNTPFELVNSPLIRARLIKLSEEQHSLVICTHHLICDGWSFGVISGDLGLFYTARLTGTVLEMEPAPRFGQYAEDVVRSALNRNDDKCDQFWQSQYDEPVPALSMPRDGDLRDGDEAGYRCKSISDHLSPETVSQLKGVASEAGATMFTLLLGAYRILLSRIGRQTRIMTPFPLSGQGANIENENLVGQCVNFLPFVGEVDLEVSFSEFLSRTQQELLEVFDHQDYTYGQLLKNLPADKRPSAEAAFKYEVLNSFDEFSGLQTDLAEVTANYLFYPLFLDVVEGADSIEFRFTFQTDQFSRETVEQWTNSYRAILETIAESKESTVSRISSALTPEQWEMMCQWNETKVDYPGEKTVISLFEEVAATRKEANALIWDGGKMSYTELKSMADHIAQHLAAKGVTEGSRVGLFLDRSAERIAAILGILKLGAAYVPLDPEYPEERLDLILEDSGTSIVVTQGSLLPRLPKHCETVIDVQVATHGELGQPFPQTFAGDSTKTAMCVMYTSGSTGNPKGAVYAHKGLIRAVCNINYCDLNPDETILHTSSICFDVSTFEMFGALLNGGTLAIPPAEPLSLGTISDCIANLNVTTLWLTSGLFQLMVEEQVEAFSGVRQLLTGGDIVPVSHSARLMKAHPELQLINCYGPTENTTFSTAHPVSKSDLARKALPVGRPISNSSVWILDQNNVPVAPGVAGELCCGGDGVCLGYLNNPELTDEKFFTIKLGENRPAERLYRSGDLCRNRADGTIEFIGRIDHQVKIRGFRVEPGEIEICLSSNPMVGQCKVIAYGEGATEKSLIAYVSPFNGHRPTPEELRDFSLSKLPAYMVPATCVVMDELPVNTNGKIDTRALPLPEIIQAREEESSEGFAPVEARLSALWVKTLKVQQIDRNDDFFALGGHSLLGMKLFAQIQREFDLSLPLSVLFKHPTVRLLAAEIQSRTGVSDSLDVTNKIPEIEKRERIEPVAVVEIPAPELEETTVLLQPHGNEPPLFGIHGGDGGVFFYRDLAKRMGASRPFYALESPFLTNGGEIPLEPVEETAARYVSEIQKIQSVGPYHICGYSFGGMIAYEMACQLEEQGAEVSFLGVIDAQNPAFDPRRRNLAERVAVNWNDPNRQGAGSLKKAASLGNRVRSGLGFRLKSDAEGLAARALPVSKNTGWLRQAQIRQANTQAQNQYYPPQYQGGITLFRATDGNDKFDYGEDFGWGQVVAGKIDLIDVPGNHITMFDQTHIHGISNGMREALSNSKDKVKA